eukprot:c14252_g1_i1 orf=573-851(-)
MEPQRCEGHSSRRMKCCSLKRMTVNYRHSLLGLQGFFCGVTIFCILLASCRYSPGFSLCGRVLDGVFYLFTCVNHVLHSFVQAIFLGLKEGL